MQTFVPYGADYWASARCLDDKRLGKQRVEAYQILRTLLNETQGWKNHPAIKMWYGYEPSLVIYTLVICAEWSGRGYQDTVAGKVCDLAGPLFNGEDAIYDPMTNELVQCDGTLERVPDIWHPLWLRNPYVAISHRSNLAHKDPNHYGRYWPELVDEPKLDYVWNNPVVYMNRIGPVVNDYVQPGRNPYMYT